MTAPGRRTGGQGTGDQRSGRQTVGGGRLKQLLRIAIAVVLLGGLFVFVVDLETFLAEVARCSPLAILAAAAGIVAGRLVVAWRWLLLVRSTHAEASFAELARLTLMGTSLSFVGPGMVGTEAYRVAGLARTTGVGTALASVVVERLTSLAGIAVVAATGLALGGLPMTNGLWLTLLAICAAIIGLSFATMVPAFRRLVDAVSGWLPAAVVARLGGLLVAVTTYAARPALLGRLFVLSVVLQGLRVMGSAALAWGLGIEVGLATLMIVVSVGILLSMLPLTPQGLGTREIAFVALLGSIGVPAAQAAALSLLFTGITAVVVFLPTLWFYFRFGIWGQAAPASSKKPGS